MTISTDLRDEYEQLQRERKNRYIANLIKEAVVNVIAEQQAAVTPNPMAAAQPAPAVPPPDPNVPMDPMANPAAAPQEEFTLDKMIEKLNVIRGGRSFTDPEIYGQLTTLFKSWDPQTVQIIEKTFDDMAKVVTLNAEKSGGDNEVAPQGANAQQPMPQAAPGAAAPAAGGMMAPAPPM